MSLIRIQNMSFAYEESAKRVFDGVTLDINADWKLGFIGRNGRGKTTFLKLLLGEFEYEGSIASNVAFEYFPFEGFDPHRETERISMDLMPSDYRRWELVRELAMLGMNESTLDRPYDTLSFGEQTKALLAILFLRPKAFLLIDEPTNHLDMAARDIVCRYLNRKRGFILVSHDRAFLDGCIDHVLSINRTNIEVVKGNFSSWYENKRNRDEGELAQNEGLKREIRRLSDAAKQAATWSDRTEQSKYGSENSGLKPDRGYVGHKAAKMMKRAKSIENRKLAAIEEKTKLLRDIESAEPLKIHPLTFHSQKLISLAGVSLNFGEYEVLHRVTLDVMRGEITAILGPNGSGKSSLLKILKGENIGASGQIVRGSGLIISYIAQDSSDLSGSLAEYAGRYRIDGSLFMAILRKLDFTREQFTLDMARFSAGQKKKAMLARSLCEQAHLYLWDEPLNYVDVLSRIQIEELLREFRPTMVLVEHDRAFVEAIGARKLEL